LGNVNKEISLENDLSSGDLLRYFNPLISDNQGGLNITSVEALSIATIFVEQNSKFPDKNIKLSSIFHDPNEGTWTITWDHILNNSVKADDDHIVVLLSDSGKVFGFGKRWEITDEFRIDPSISREDAKILAEKYLKLAISNSSKFIPHINCQLETINLTISESLLIWNTACLVYGIDEKGSAFSKTYYVKIDASSGKQLDISGRMDTRGVTY